MSEIPTQGQSIIVDAEGNKPISPKYAADLELAGYISGKVQPWEDHRNMGYSARWKEYWRMWRGIWHSDDKNRASERSKLIAPALAQAIEASVAEVEEILLSKEAWFDSIDNMHDEEPSDVAMSRRHLLHKMDEVNAKGRIKEAVLNCAIFGTGIIKLNVLVEKDKKPIRDKQGRLVAQEKEVVYVVPESVRPDEFIPDPAARSIEEMAGCAVRTVRPMHYALEKIASGEYRKDALAMLASTAKPRSGYEADFGVDAAATVNVGDAEPITITEYHGKVPLSLLNKVLRREERNVLDDLLDAETIDPSDDSLVEAIVVIANDSILLKAMINPFTMGDRSIIAFPWEQVPGRFWGRGVAEKGWNPQKALDAELRSRQDALGFISAPMIGVDSGRMPRGHRYEVKPGKIWPTNGAPREVIQPIEMGALQQATFSQTQEMERMVQMGTGAFDTAASLKGGQTQSGANSAGSNSMMMGAFVKRAKRSASNIELYCIQPLIRKALWRYMQFDPENFPVDFDFKVVGNMGIVAREVEAMQMTQLLGMMPQEVAPQVALALINGIVDMSSIINKPEVMGAIKQAMQPPPPEEQAMAQELKKLQFEAQKAQATQFVLENQKTIAEIRKTLNEALLALRKADQEDEKVKQETARVLLQLAELEEMKRANELDDRRLDLEEKRIDKMPSGGSK